MVKLVSPNRKGQWKEFKEEDVANAKANGWTEKDKPQPKKKKVVKGDK